jgi:hypothetical protein
MTELQKARVSGANARPSPNVPLVAPRRRHRALLRRGAAALTSLAVGLIGAAIPAAADRIKHPIAVFSGLDKITGRIISFEVAMNETVQFGSLQITERACYTRPATEAPQTTAFLEIDEIDAEKNYKRLFSGWMFAASPGLHGLEHPVYDVWLIDCKGGTIVIPTPPDTAAIDPPPPENAKPVAVPPPKPVKPKRTPAADEAKTDGPNGRDGPVEVAPPPGFNNPPDRRAPPAQRFYPTPN